MNQNNKLSNKPITLNINNIYSNFNQPNNNIAASINFTTKITEKENDILIKTVNTIFYQNVKSTDNCHKPHTPIKTSFTTKEREIMKIPDQQQSQEDKKVIYC